MAVLPPLNDKIDAAIGSAEAKAEVEALSQVTITFLADGGLHMATKGDFRPSMAWAMSEFLRNVGDDMMREATRLAREKMAAQQPHILVPQSAMGRIG